ncbi:LuxR C-terminal-related transcriptional regulator [Salinibacterium sp. ZJ450]|uniref:helix-turn-helix transcriptional regulator n=1 Tax=Salinibacterium sp. ZJ450 TaxID=2708338 RepID=UPI00141E71E2|nr:LuxR C-terminal-related transcriptional regulator [Salinibacterium sp. ZJ450]
MDWPIRGRAEESANVLQALGEGSRLVTLIGSAGVGKTQLARLVSDHVRSQGKGWFDLDDDGGIAIPAAVAEFVGGWSGREDSPVIFLDTSPATEPSAAELVSQLMDNHPTLRVVATARGALGVPRERLVVVRPLPTPSLSSDGIPDDEWLALAPAAVMFLDRANAISPTLTLNRETFGAVSAICRRLGGLPLAIHIAALQYQLFSVDAILKELDKPLRFLRVGFRESSLRNESLKASIQAGLHGLAAEHINVLAVLARFPGGCSITALRAVGFASTGLSRRDPLAILSDLVRTGVVMTEASSNGTRFVLPPFHADYFLELRALGPVAETSDAIKQFIVDQCATAAESRGPAWDAAARLFAAEYANIVHFLSQAESQSRLSEAAELLDLTCRYWIHSGPLEDGLAFAEIINGHAKLDPLARARAVGALAALRARSSSYTSAYREFAQAVALWREMEDRRRLATALLAFSTAALEVDGWNSAQRAVTEAINIFRDLGDDWSTARATAQLGSFAAHVPGQSEFARTCLESSAAALQSLGDTGAATLPLQHLGKLLLDDGEHEQARLVLERGLHEIRSVGDQFQESSYLNLLGLCEIGLGRFGTAAGRFLDSLHIAVNLGLKGRAVWCLEELSDSLTLLGATAASTAASASAHAIREQLDLRDWVEFASPRRTQRPAGVSFAMRMVVTEGTIWPPRVVLDRVPQVLAEIAQSSHLPPTTGDPLPDGLTAREAEVLALIGHGMTSRAIASELVISIDTVGRHITNLYRKIGARGRADATAYALRMKLLTRSKEPATA